MTHNNFVVEYSYLKKIRGFKWMHMASFLAIPLQIQSSSNDLLYFFNLFVLFIVD